MITGIVQTTRTNDYGYSSYKISSTWYGADSKGPPRASEGEKVSFEAFDKPPGKEGKVYPTIKLATFKKVAASPTTETGSSNQSASTSTAGKSVLGATAGRDTYWSDKAAEDAKKDPRIVYQSSFERAILFVDLAIRTKCFQALEKAKETEKLGILQAFVDEQAERIMGQVYAAKIPELGNKGTTSEQVVTDIPATTAEEDWS